MLFRYRIYDPTLKLRTLLCDAWSRRVLSLDKQILLLINKPAYRSFPRSGEPALKRCFNLLRSTRYKFALEPESATKLTGVFRGAYLIKL